LDRFRREEKLGEHKDKPQEDEPTDISRTKGRR
jgi:hypothetical protein